MLVLVTAAAFSMTSAASAFAVMASTATSVFTMASAASSLFSVSAAAVASATAAVTLLRKEFSVKSLGKFFLRSFAYRKDLAGEVQHLSGHRVVEVDSHAFLLDFHD